jgi:tetratricopeptide (TPR) repeat protein
MKPAFGGRERLNSAFGCSGVTSTSEGSFLASVPVLDDEYPAFSSSANTVYFPHDGSFSKRYSPRSFVLACGDYFNQAIAIDPNYGLAYSGLAYNYINQDDWFMSPNEAGPNARDAAERALAIDESDAGAHLSLALVDHWYEWNWVAAESEFKRAIELSPNDSEAHGYYAGFLAPMGRKDQALAEAKRSQQADPLSSLGNFIVEAGLVFTAEILKNVEQNLIPVPGPQHFDYNEITCYQYSKGCIGGESSPY